MKDLGITTPFSWTGLWQWHTHSNTHTHTHVRVITHINTETVV